MKRRLMNILLALVLMLLFAGTALAQDVTEAPAATDTAPVVTEPAPDNQPSADPAITLKWWQVLAGIALAFGGGGAVGIAGVGVIAMRIKNDKATMTAIEELAKSVPADVVKVILGVARSGKAIAEVTEEAFDGVPVATKPASAG